MVSKITLGMRDPECGHIILDMCGPSSTCNYIVLQHN